MKTCFHNILILNNHYFIHKLPNSTRTYGGSTPTKQYELDSEEDDLSEEEE